MILVDSHSIIIRYFFALREDHNKLPSMFLFLLERLWKKYESHFVFFFDECTNNFRNKLYPEYKGNRKSMNPMVYSYINLIKQSVQEVKFPVFGSDVYEADDLIGSFATQYGGGLILSTDKDLLQLVNDKIKVLNPFKKELFDQQKVYEKYKVLPDDLALYFAIVGDSSDNIPGVKGYGPKRTLSLFQNPEVKQQLYETLENGLSLTRIVTNISLQVYGEEFFTNSTEKLSQLKNIIGGDINDILSR